MRRHRFFHHHARRFAANPSLFIPAPHDLVVRSELSVTHPLRQLRDEQIRESIIAGEKVRKPDLKRFTNPQFFIENSFGIFPTPEKGGHATGRAFSVLLFAMHLLQMIEARSGGISMLSRPLAKLEVGNVDLWENAFFPEHIVEGFHTADYRERLMVPVSLLDALANALGDYCKALSEDSENVRSPEVRKAFRDCFFWKAGRDLVFSYIFRHTLQNRKESDKKLGENLVVGDYYDTLREYSDRAADEICRAAVFRRTLTEEVQVSGGDPRSRYDDDVGGSKRIYRRNRSQVPFVTNPNKPNATDLIQLLSIVPECDCTANYFAAITRDPGEEGKRDRLYLLEMSAGFDQEGASGCTWCASFSK